MYFEKLSSLWRSRTASPSPLIPSLVLRFYPSSTTRSSTPTPRHFILGDTQKNVNNRLIRRVWSISMSVHPLNILLLGMEGTHGKSWWSLEDCLIMFTYTLDSPGRFFATNEIKSMLIHIMTNYDIKFENDTGRPQNAHIFIQAYPSGTAKILFRKRQT